VPRDTIERAIKKGAGLTGEVVNYELITYEGFAPHKVPVIVECLTDNRHRTAPEIRVLFKQGQLGAMGSVSWMFNHVGVVEAHHADKSLDLETVALKRARRMSNLWKRKSHPQTTSAPGFSATGSIWTPWPSFWQKRSGP